MIALGKFHEFFHVLGGGRIHHGVGKILDNALPEAHNVNHRLAVTHLHALEFLGGDVVVADDFPEFFQLLVGKAAGRGNIHHFVAHVHHFLEIVVGEPELLFDEFVKTLFGTFPRRGVAPFHNGAVTSLHGRFGNPLGLEIFIRFG